MDALVDDGDIRSIGDQLPLEPDPRAPRANSGRQRGRRRAERIKRQPSRKSATQGNPVMRWTMKYAAK